MEDNIDSLQATIESANQVHQGDGSDLVNEDVSMDVAEEEGATGELIEESSNDEHEIDELDESSESKLDDFMAKCLIVNVNKDIEYKVYERKNAKLDCEKYCYSSKYSDDSGYKYFTQSPKKCTHLLIPSHKYRCVNNKYTSYANPGVDNNFRTVMRQYLFHNHNAKK